MRSFLDHLAEVHEVYGVTTGATAKRSESQVAVVRETATALSDSLRTYVVRVVGMLDRKRPETREQVDALLQPLTSWTSSASASADEESGDDPVTPPAPSPADAPRPVG